MSWQDHVDPLVASGKAAGAAILSLDGSVWAITSGFALSDAERAKLATAFSNLDATQAGGITAAGQKYFTIEAGDRRIHGKKGPDGILLIKTKQTIFIAIYKPPIQAPEITPDVEGRADWLINAGY